MLSRVAGAARSMGCVMERRVLRAPVSVAAPLRRMPTGAAPALRSAGAKVRTMATGGAKPAQDSPLVLFRKYLPQIALGGGALVVVYGISKIMIYVTSGLMSLDFKDVFYYGYLTGAVSVLVVAAGATYALRLARINPEGAFRRALSRVQADASAQAVLGTNIRGGNLKAYTIQPGHVSLAKRLAWVEPRVQMLFQVRVCLCVREHYYRMAVTSYKAALRHPTYHSHSCRCARATATQAAETGSPHGRMPGRLQHLSGCGAAQADDKSIHYRRIFVSAADGAPMLCPCASYSRPGHSAVALLTGMRG